MKSRTTVITVAFNSAHIIEEMLASIPHEVGVRVVDNGSTDDIRKKLKNFKNCKLISNGSNQGFGRACNRGAEKSSTDFLFFLNPDAKLKNNTILELERFADKNQKMGAANPLIKNGKGKTRLKMSSIVPSKNVPRPKINEFGEMPVLSGGALFVRREIFEAIGGFDPNIFLYHEDHELCNRISKLGYSLWHVPSAIAEHIGGRSSGSSIEIAQWKGFQMARSRYYVLSKFYPSGAFTRTFWPAVYGLSNPLNLLSRRRRSKYIGQIKGALSARSDGGIFEKPKATNL